MNAQVNALRSILGQRKNWYVLEDDEFIFGGNDDGTIFILTTDRGLSALAGSLGQFSAYAALLKQDGQRNYHRFRYAAETDDVQTIPYVEYLTLTDLGIEIGLVIIPFEYWRNLPSLDLGNDGEVSAIDVPAALIVAAYTYLRKQRKEHEQPLKHLPCATWVLESNRRNRPRTSR